MAASKQDLAGWFRQGVANNCTHMIVVCDTFDYNDYPVYVKAGQDPKEVAKEKDLPVTGGSNQNMQRIMEVYDLRLSMDDQLEQSLVMNW